jgi:hypothetical protein
VPIGYLVSIQRVCTVNGRPASAGANASSATSVRWSGSPVGTPATSNSPSARRARSSACTRVAPTTTSLASNEPNSDPTTEPCSTPESSRTPGPDGGRHAVTMPRAGEKPRSGSSA